MRYSSGQPVDLLRSITSSWPPPSSTASFLLQLEAYLGSDPAASDPAAAGAYIPDGELAPVAQRHRLVRVRSVAIDPRFTPFPTRPSRFPTARSRRSAEQPEAVRASPPPPWSASSRSTRHRRRHGRRTRPGPVPCGRRSSTAPTSARSRGASPRQRRQPGRDLGSFSHNVMITPFEEAVWSLPIGSVSEPVDRVKYLIRWSHPRCRLRLGPPYPGPRRPAQQSQLALLETADSLELLGERVTLDQAVETLGLAAPRSSWTRSSRRPDPSAPWPRAPTGPSARLRR